MAVNYQEIDESILKSIESGDYGHPTLDPWMQNIARGYCTNRSANMESIGRRVTVIINRRMQVLRKAGKIRYDQKARQWEVIKP